MLPLIKMPNHRKTKQTSSVAFVRSHDIRLDVGYIAWLSDLKERFLAARLSAAVRINSSHLEYYWQLGRDLFVKKAEERWGEGIVEQLSLDLQAAFPGTKGFSARNLWYAKRWFLFYAGDPESQKLQQPVAEMEMPEMFGQLPWGHHIAIVSKCNSASEALFYMRRAIEEGWSRSTLQNGLKGRLFENSGGAVSNFAERLPAPQGRLAQQLTKDTYDFGFLSLPVDYDEEMLETALERNIARFLLELGSGFAFVGRQKEILVAGKTRRIDMLFYHIRLKCYVVVELKSVPFEPEFAGKLNFYVSAVDELLRTTNENKTIGLLICKDKDSTEVRWSFRGMDAPMGVASYDKIKLQEIKAELPSEEQIKERLLLPDLATRQKEPASPALPGDVVE